MVNLVSRSSSSGRTSCRRGTSGRALSSAASASAGHRGFVAASTFSNNAIKFGGSSSSLSVRRQ